MVIVPHHHLIQVAVYFYWYLEYRLNMMYQSSWLQMFIRLQKDVKVMSQRGVESKISKQLKAVY